MRTSFGPENHGTELGGSKVQVFNGGGACGEAAPTAERIGGCGSRKATERGPGESYTATMRLWQALVRSLSGHLAPW